MMSGATSPSPNHLLGRLIEMPLAAERRRVVEEVLAILHVEHGIAALDVLVVSRREIDDESCSLSRKRERTFSCVRKVPVRVCCFGSSDMGEIERMATLSRQVPNHRRCAGYLPFPAGTQSALSPGGATVIRRAPKRHASMYPGSLTAQKVSRISGFCSRLTDSSPTAS